jgi:hypothetical protein
MGKKSKSNQNQLSTIELYQLDKQKREQRYENNLKKLKKMSKVKAGPEVVKQLCKSFIKQPKALPVKKSVFTEDDWKRFDQEYVAK